MTQINIPLDILQLALSKSDCEPLTAQEMEICEEWTTGKALDYMKVDTGNPRLLEFAGFYANLECKKEAKWEGIIIRMNNQNS